MNDTSKDESNSTPPRIGLALSGGGFRASIFHLGVIRRLEELGIMKCVHTISAVSGGSIIAAYYVLEMEKRLRRRRKELRVNPEELDAIRLQTFEEIAGSFFQALDHNLRSRALVFTPFYHPILWIKSWWPTLSRSDVMQKEYDKWFYHDETLDHFPSVALPQDKTSSELETPSLVFTGPTVVLNTTSLLTGERKGFKREPTSRIHELNRVNQNILKLSRVVGASSGVPGLFPPTTIFGDKLVDGGVADNQGIDVLVRLDRILTGDKGGSANDHVDFDVLLVSDASGHMGPVHRLRDRAFVVMNRTLSIFQFQIRRKMLKILRLWQSSDGREFAFVHLFLNLKDRINTPPRVPSEFIPALGGIRTDLDQFSLIEREALMYHGYTLIDAQIQEHCERLKKFIRNETDSVPQLVPPLFRDGQHSDPAPEKYGSESKLRKRVKNVLTAGSGSVFLSRSRRKYPKKSWLVFGPAILLWLGGWWAGRYNLDSLYAFTLKIERWLSFLIPDWGRWVLENVVGSSSFPLDTRILTLGVWIVLWSYIVAFLTYEAMRWMVSQWDRTDYQSLTGEEPTVHWATSDTSSKVL